MDETLKLSALTSSLPMELPAAIEAIAGLGFHWIDVPPTADTIARQALKARGLAVACVALERDAPGNMDLASADAATRSRSVHYFRQAIARTAELEVFVGANARFRGTPGRLGGRLCVQILSAVDEIAGALPSSTDSAAI